MGKVNSAELNPIQRALIRSVRRPKNDREQQQIVGCEGVFQDERPGEAARGKSICVRKHVRRDLLHACVGEILQRGLQARMKSATHFLRVNISLLQQ